MSATWPITSAGRSLPPPRPHDPDGAGAEESRRESAKGHQRRGSEGRSDDHGEEHPIGEYWGPDLYAVQEREAAPCAFRHGGDDDSDDRARREGSHGRAEDGDHDALCQDLARQSTSACSQGSADGKLPRPSQAAGQGKAGEVGADDEEHEGQRGDEAHHDRPDAADDLVSERHHRHTPTRVGLRVGGGEPSHHPRQRGLGRR